MLNLKPLIARFVDDVLRAIRSASVTDLQELRAEPAGRARASKRRGAIARSQPAGTRSKGTARPRGPRRASPSPRATLSAQLELPSIPPPVAEITPIRSGSSPACRARRGARGRRTGSRAGRAPGPPRCSRRSPQPPAASAPEEEAPETRAIPDLDRIALERFRDGESISRAAGGGLIIRRPKKG